MDGGQRRSLSPRLTASLAASARGSQLQLTLHKVKHMSGVYSIMLEDHLKVNDHHSEGSISRDHFRRILDNLGVFRLTEADLVALETEFGTWEPVGSRMQRIDYRRFCADIDCDEVAAFDAADETYTSPISVKELDPRNMTKVTDLNRRLFAAFNRRRLDFRSFLSAFDRMAKTRSGGTLSNHTIPPGCISRSQLVQALAGMNTTLKEEELDLLCLRYSRLGDFNYLAFLKDLEAIEAMTGTSFRASVYE